MRYWKRPSALVRRLRIASTTYSSSCWSSSDESGCVREVALPVRLRWWLRLLSPVLPPSVRGTTASLVSSLRTGERARGMARLSVSTVPEWSLAE